MNHISIWMGIFEGEEEDEFRNSQTQPSVCNPFAQVPEPARMCLQRSFGAFIFTSCFVYYVV